jgi:hypothetical protein
VNEKEVMKGRVNCPSNKKVSPKWYRVWSKIYHIISKAPAMPDAIRQPVIAFLASVVAAAM